MENKERVWLEWNGRSEALRRAESDVSCGIRYLRSIGKERCGNAVVWGNAVDAVRFASRASGSLKFDFAYVNPQNADPVKSAKTEVLSSLVQILMHIRTHLSDKRTAVVRPAPSMISETAVLLGDVFPERIIKRTSVMRGYDGFTELVLACPANCVPSETGWRWWSGMVETCCPKKGNALFVGIDEAAAGFMNCARLECINAGLTLVFPMETVVNGCFSFRKNAFDAWSFIQDEASRQAPYFCGIDVYEMHSVLDGGELKNDS